MTDLGDMKKIGLTSLQRGDTFDWSGENWEVCDIITGSSHDKGRSKKRFCSIRCVEVSADKSDMDVPYCEDALQENKALFGKALQNGPLSDRMPSRHIKADESMFVTKLSDGWPWT